MRRVLAVGLWLWTVSALGQTTFHGNVARTGVYESAGPTQLKGVKWTFKTGAAIVASPAISDGVIYITSLDGHLYAIDQETGKEKWNFKSRMPIASSPAVSGGTLYFVSSVGALAAIEVATGKPKWAFATEFERKFEAKNLHGYPSPAQTIPDAWDMWTSSPAVANGRVYFGSGDGNVYAVTADTGIELWKVQTKDVVHASPAVFNNTVYIGSWDSYLYAFNAETGEEKWSFKAGEDNTIHNQVGFQSSPAVVDGVVYVGCRDGHVYALDAANGHKKWDYSTNKSWVNGTPAVRDGVVYVGTSDSARFMALDAKNGRLRWNFGAKAYMFSSAALAGDLAYVGDHNGKLYAIDAKTGKLAWEFQTEASKNDPMKLLNADGSFKQEALSPVFGDFEDMYIDFYRFISIGAIMSSPAVDRGVVYFGSMDGNLYALQFKAAWAVLLLALCSALLRAQPVQHDRAFWQSVATNHYTVPENQSASVLALELSQLRGSPDPELRDDLAYSILATWIARPNLLQSPTLLALTDEWRANLKNEVGETGSDSVVRRSFSALCLASLAEREAKTPFFGAARYHQLLTDAIAYLQAERDLRGYDARLGWIHATAHTADLLQALAGSSLLSADEQSKILSALADRLSSAPQVYTQGEQDRIAAAAVAVIRRPGFDGAAFESWMTRLQDEDRRVWANPLTPETLARYQNHTYMLQALAVRFSLEPDSPPITGFRQKVLAILRKR